MTEGNTRDTIKIVQHEQNIVKPKKLQPSPKRKSKLSCPICHGKDGIVAKFINGSTSTELFAYCSACGWEYSKSEGPE